MKWICSLGLVVCMATTPIAMATEHAQLEGLLNDFLANTVNDDLKNHERFWAEELIYTSSTGSRFDKQKIIRDILSSENSPEMEEAAPSYSAEEVDIRRYGRTAIVAFKLVAKWAEDGEQKTQHYFNTGTFLKRKGQWQAVAWQATKIPLVAVE